MFKTRIERWGIEKKLKASEVLAIVRFRKEYPKSNQPTEFVIHGKIISWSDVQRYLRRSRKTITQLEADASRRCESVQTIDCRIHFPETKSSRFKAEPFTAIDLPEDLKMFEMLSTLFPRYIAGAMESDTWLVDNDRMDFFGRYGYAGYEQLTRWTDGLLQASGILKGNRSNHGFALISDCLDRTGQIIRGEDPDILHDMLRVVIYLYVDDPYIGNEVASFFKKMTMELLPKQHPIRVFWQQWDHLRNLDLYEALTRTFRPYVDFIINTLHPCSPNILAVTDSYLAFCHALPGVSFKKIELETRSILARLLQTAGVSEDSTMFLKMWLAKLLFEQRIDSSEAMELMESAEIWLSDKNDTSSQIEWLRYDIYRVKSYICHAAADWQSAYDLACKWAHHFQETRGPTDWVTLGCYEDIVEYGRELCVEGLEQHELEYDEMIKQFSSKLWLDDERDDERDSSNEMD